MSPGKAHSDERGDPCHSRCSKDTLQRAPGTDACDVSSGQQPYQSDGEAFAAEIAWIEPGEKVVKVADESERGGCDGSAEPDRKRSPYAQRSEEPHVRLTRSDK